MKRILITGTNRGLGFELISQYLERGDLVFAGCRKPIQAKKLQELLSPFPDQLKIIKMDVTKDAEIKAARKFVEKEAGGLDLLINNAAILKDNESLKTVSAKNMLQTFSVNSVSPIIVIQNFLEILQAGKEPKAINISSEAGSMHKKVPKNQGFPTYRASKSSLNMLTRILAVDLEETNIAFSAIHPGWVQTDMGGPEADLTPNVSAANILKIIDGITKKDSGKFYDYSGEEHPW